MIQELLLLSIVISFFCVGLRIISSPEIIFYILRQPYEWAIEKSKECRDGVIEEKRILAEIKSFIKYSSAQLLRRLEPRKFEELKERREQAYKDLIETDKSIKHYKIMAPLMTVLKLILKPIIGCGTCMASVWTLVLYPIMVDTLDYRIFVCAFIVACFNSLIMALYELMEAKKKCNC